MKNMENNSLKFDYNDGVLRVAIVGEINHHRAVSVRQEIDEKIQELRPQNLVLDLADAPFMDSSGLGLIMGRRRTCAELSVEMALAGVSEDIIKILRLTGLIREIEILQKI